MGWSAGCVSWCRILTERPIGQLHWTRQVGNPLWSPLANRKGERDALRCDLGEATALEFSVALESIAKYFRCLANAGGSGWSDRSCDHAVEILEKASSANGDAGRHREIHRDVLVGQSDGFAGAIHGMDNFWLRAHSIHGETLRCSRTYWVLSFLCATDSEQLAVLALIDEEAGLLTFCQSMTEAQTVFDGGVRLRLRPTDSRLHWLRSARRWKVASDL